MKVHEKLPSPGMGLASRLRVERLKIAPSLTVKDGSTLYSGGSTYYAFECVEILLILKSLSIVTSALFCSQKYYIQLADHD